MARRVGDPMALVSALYSRHAALVGSQNVQERLDVSTELLKFAQASGNKEMELRARYRRILDLLEIGDIPAVDQEIETYSALAEELRQPRYLWLTPFCKASRALLEGKFEECERLAQQALSIGLKSQDRAAVMFHGVQMNLLRVEQGRAEEMIPVVKEWIKAYPMVPGNWATLAYVYSNADLLENSRREFERVAVNNFAGLPRDGSWIVVLSMLAYVCFMLKDADRAAVLYEYLLPFAGRTIVTASAPVACGWISRPLGLFAAAMSRWDDAARHYEEAIEMNTKLNAPSFLAGSQHEYGLVLLARNQPGDRDRAIEVFDRALATADGIGMRRLIEQLRAAKSKVSSITP
jgi:hypothetical protein